MATTHAKNRPPSAAKRWLSCPFSSKVAPMYGNDETDASLKGDRWHKLMEDQITFGTTPLDCEPDAAEAMEELYAYVQKRFKEMGGPGVASIYVEQQLDIPQTGEFGTADIILVSPEWLEIVDEKSGYVVVDVKQNAQLMVYLLGAIAKYGTRPNYRIGIHQPNFDHIDGPLRFYDVTTQDLATLEYDIHMSMENPDHCEAGHHCKATYCDHRGACEAFRLYALNDLSLGWHPSELKAMSDDDLAKALDAADELNGYRQVLRSEAMRRIMNMDRKVHGYKMVKGRRNRSVADAKALVHAIRDSMGLEWAVRCFDPSMAWASATFSQGVVKDNPPEEILKHLGTPKHIEDVIKQYARQYRLPRGGWKKVYDNVVGEYIRELSSGLTLERAIDGRPAHKRGSEFGVLDPASSVKSTNLASSTIVL